MPQAQTATVKLPKKIKAKGKTVLLKKAVVTNAGQKATAKLTWSTKKSAKGAKAKYANQEVSHKTGKVTIRTTGKAKRLYVKLSLSAPAIDGYQAYSFTKKWTVKRRPGVRRNRRFSPYALRDARSGPAGPGPNSASRSGCPRRR